MAQDKLLTGADVAEMLGVTDETVRRWAEKNQLAHIRLPSGHRRYRRSDVEAFLLPVEPAPDTEAVG
jgi:excisionase family DNA binding protein